MTEPQDFTPQQASDPSTPAQTLADIAALRPDLRPAIAANPSSYPGLLEWLGALGDPQVNAALEARSASAAGQLAPEAPAVPAGQPVEAPAEQPSSTTQPVAEPSQTEAPTGAQSAAQAPEAHALPPQTLQPADQDPMAAPGAGPSPSEAAPQQPAAEQQWGAQAASYPAPGEPYAGSGYPGQASPGQPGQAYPGQPGQAYPGQPGQAYPGEPGQQFQGQPGAAYPGQPYQAGMDPYAGTPPKKSSTGKVLIIIGIVVVVLIGLMIAAFFALRSFVGSIEDQIPEITSTVDGSSGDGTYGSDPELDVLWDACEGGDWQACDDLYFDAPVDSEYEEFGRTCGGRTDGWDYCVEELGG